MIFRLFTVGVFVFCGVMTTWLVRSVYFPEYERLPSVDPSHVLDLFLENEEVTHAFVYRGRTLVGDVMVTSRRHGESNERAKIRFIANSQADSPEFQKQDLKWKGSLDLGPAPSRSIEKIGLTVKFKEPEMTLSIDINPQNFEFHYLLIQDGEILADSNKDPENEEIAQMKLLFEVLRMSPQSNQASSLPIDARWGKANIAGRRSSVYFLRFELPGSGQIKLTFSEAGEFLEMSTALGYQVLSETLSHSQYLKTSQ
ncbi:MAG: hypothetical protein EVB09_08230 [Verrucomicrobiaceae bacterium]|nr:MAG: hypothetical protein EVB09_08230 [Verrucomicrobiaceae bacterium]